MPCQEYVAVATSTNFRDKLILATGVLPEALGLQDSRVPVGLSVGAVEEERVGVVAFF